MPRPPEGDGAGGVALAVGLEPFFAGLEGVRVPGEPTRTAATIRPRNRATRMATVAKGLTQVLSAGGLRWSKNFDGQAPMFDDLWCGEIMGLPRHPIKRSAYGFVTGLLAAISSLVLWIYQASLDLHVEGEEHLFRIQAEGRNYLLTVWHSFVDAAVFVFHSRNILIYSDHPRTEEYERSVAHFFREVGIKTLRTLGFGVLDASLGKQSAGILNFIKAIREGSPAMLAPDGPHGPIYRAKPGSAYIAEKTGSPILPVGFGFSRKIVGPNWDDFALPLPFSRVMVIIGEPMTPAAGESQDAFSARLEATLDALCFAANDRLRAAATNSAPVPS